MRETPIDLDLSALFGSSPKTIMEDVSAAQQFEAISYNAKEIKHYIEEVLQLEAVASKDWLTNKWTAVLPDA